MPNIVVGRPDTVVGKTDTTVMKSGMGVRWSDTAEDTTNSAVGSYSVGYTPVHLTWGWNINSTREKGGPNLRKEAWNHDLGKLRLCN